MGLSIRIRDTNFNKIKYEKTIFINILFPYFSDFKRSRNEKTVIENFNVNIAIRGTKIL